jgi:hypothetical protein
MKLPDKSFIFVNSPVSPTIIKDDKWYVTPSAELTRIRRNNIARSLDINKLNNSSLNNIKGKANSYSDKELAEMLIMLGCNATGLKSVHIAALLRIKNQYDNETS